MVFGGFLKYEIKSYKLGIGFLLFGILLSNTSAEVDV